MLLTEAWYSQQLYGSKEVDKEERLCIVRTAAAIILEDMLSTVSWKCVMWRGYSVIIFLSCELCL